jgi:hypothetical protein
MSQANPIRGAQLFLSSLSFAPARRAPRIADQELTIRSVRRSTESDLNVIAEPEV